MRLSKRASDRQRALIGSTLMIGVVVWAMGCGSNTVTNPGSFSFERTPGMSVAQGQSGHATVTVNRTGSFTGPISLTAFGQPAHVTVVFEPATISAAGHTSNVMVTVDPGIAVGKYFVIIKGTGSGTQQQTITMPLTVTPSPSISLRVDSSSFAVVPGGPTRTSTVTIQRSGGFSGDVHLAVSDLPTGIMAQLSSSTVSLNVHTATISVSADNRAKLGGSKFTVTASAVGVPEVKTALAFAVASNSAGTVTVTYCGSYPPTHLFARDGTSGDFTAVSPVVGTTYVLSFPSGKGALVAVTRYGSDDFAVDVSYGSVADWGGPTGSNSCSDGADGAGGIALNGSVAGMADGQTTTVRIGFGSGSVSAPHSHFTVPNAASAPQDLVATLSDSSHMLAMIVRRDLRLGNGSTITPVLDFSDASEAFTPGTANVTLAGLVGGQQASLVSTLTTQHGTWLVMSSAAGLANGHYPFAVIPAEKQASADFIAFAAKTGMGRDSQTVSLVTNGVADQTLTFGPALSTPTVTEDGSTYIRPHVVLRSQSPYDRGASASFSEYAESPDTDKYGDPKYTSARRAFIQVSRNYYGSAPANWDFAFPDLDGVAGWQDLFGLQHSHVRNYAVFASGGTATTVGSAPTSEGRYYSASHIVGSGSAVADRSARDMLRAPRDARVRAP